MSGVALELLRAGWLPVRCDQFVPGRLTVSSPSRELTLSGSLPRMPLRWGRL